MRLLVLAAAAIILGAGCGGSRDPATATSTHAAASYTHAFRAVGRGQAWWHHVMAAKPSTGSDGTLIRVTADLPLGTDGKAADPELAQRICRAAAGAADVWKSGREGPVHVMVETKDPYLLASCDL